MAKQRTVFYCTECGNETPKWAGKCPACGRQAPQHMDDTIAASLTVGCMKINAVMFLSDGALRLGYDVYVKDSPGSSEWICFDCPSDRASLKESDMLSVLDRIVIKNGLSYTECCFERLEGIMPPDKKIG